MPEIMGKSAHTTRFVDANHTGYVVTWRSHKSVLIYVTNALIIWFSKKHTTVDSSTFVSESVAMRIARDLIASLQYKLRAFGVHLDGPSDVMCDNQGVVNNTSLNHYNFGKKHNTVNYNVVREVAASGILRVRNEDTETNLAYLPKYILGLK